MEFLSKYKEKLFFIGTIIVLLGIFCICLPILAFKGMLNAQTLGNILSLILSWPVAMIIIALFLLTRHKSSIDIFLQNIRSVNFPGGNVQLQKQSDSASLNMANDANGDVKLTKDQSSKIAELIKKQQEELHTASRKAEDLRKDILSAYKQSIYWKFSYLNIFYVLNTKYVLNWFSRFSPQTRDSYHQYWQSWIPNIDERETILKVLELNKMLSIEDSIVKITTEGYAFLQFIGVNLTGS